MKEAKDKILSLTIHWDTMLERTMASFIGGITAGTVLFIITRVF